MLSNDLFTAKFNAVEFDVINNISMIEQMVADAEAQTLISEAARLDEQRVAAVEAFKATKAGVEKMGPVLGAKKAALDTLKAKYEELSKSPVEGVRNMAAALKQAWTEQTKKYEAESKANDAARNSLPELERVIEQLQGEIYVRLTDARVAAYNMRLEAEKKAQWAKDMQEAKRIKRERIMDELMDRGIDDAFACALLINERREEERIEAEFIAEQQRKLAELEAAKLAHVKEFDPVAAKASRAAAKAQKVQQPQAPARVGNQKVAPKTTKNVVESVGEFESPFAVALREAQQAA